MIISAKRTCKNGWLREYTGYLMAGWFDHKSATEYICMDSKAQRIGDPKNSNGRLFYPVEAQCGSLPCGPYIAGGELTCVVCSK